VEITRLPGLTPWDLGSFPAALHPILAGRPPAFSAWRTGFGLLAKNFTRD